MHELAQGERLELDRIYRVVREALNQGIPIRAIQEELDSAYRAHVFTASKTIEDWKNAHVD